MTTWVSGGACRSRSSLRLGASEGESDALLGKGSGSRDHWRVRELRGPLMKGCRERAEQAVAFEAFDCDRQHLADDVGRGKHMRRLQVSGAADDLPGVARGPLEQHVDGGPNR